MDKLLRPFMWTAEEGALTMLYLGTAVERLEAEDIRGEFFHPMALKIEDHPDARDNDEATNVLRQKLWNFLDELVADFV